MRSTRWLAFLVITVVFYAIGCKGDTQGNKKADESVALNGAGATFPYPLYSKWASAYQTKNPNVKINYQSVGSGAGIKQITDKTVDFGASDSPMNDEQLAKAPGPIAHIPMTLGAVVITYNVPGAPAHLRLTPEVLTAIFVGEIKTWNDPKIASMNPDAKLPVQAISVVHRSDGSGTTAVFTGYLAQVSSDWKSKVGAGTAVNWPMGIGAKGNEGVTGQIKITPGSIGYVELAYAAQNQLPTAALRNKAGQFSEPTLEGVTAAAAGFSDVVPADLRMSIVDAPGASAYPISAFTYILVYQNAADAPKATALAEFLWWAIHDGQEFAPALSYAKLPAGIITRTEAKLRTLKAGETILLAGR